MMDRNLQIALIYNAFVCGVRVGKGKGLKKKKEVDLPAIASTGLGRVFFKPSLVHAAEYVYVYIMGVIVGRFKL